MRLVCGPAAAGYGLVWLAGPRAHSGAQEDTTVEHKPTEIDQMIQVWNDVVASLAVPEVDEGPNEQPRNATSCADLNAI